MIAGKLILFFCFFLLLLLENSLGRKLLVEQDGNKGLFKRAIKFGQTYRGELGELGSQWKQLLIQFVHAKQNVGLGQYQLARFNDSATEEVGLAITDNYADRVAELVAVRVQDIGSTQKYIDELDILKNEIALTMIVEMDELEEKFKEKNVREKVKEAKENGLTDTDIKELLFAEYFNSGGGLSLIGGGASTGDALLSSFRGGMECLLDKRLCIIQYANGKGNDVSTYGGGASGGGGGSGGVPDDGRDVFPPDGGAPGGATGGGGSGGDPPGGPPTSPPTSEDDLDDSHEKEEDKKKNNKTVDPKKYLAAEFQKDYQGIELDYDDEKMNIQMMELEKKEEQEEEEEFSLQERIDVEKLVAESVEPIRIVLNQFEDDLRNLEQEIAAGYSRFSLSQRPTDRVLNITDEIDLTRRRIEYLDGFSSGLNGLRRRFRETYKTVYPKYVLTSRNLKHYEKLFQDKNRDEGPSPSMPPLLPEFQAITVGPNDVNRIRLLISRRLWPAMKDVAVRYNRTLQILRRLKDMLRRDLNDALKKNDELMAQLQNEDNEDDLHKTELR